MANRALLDILTSGVAEWNEWKAEHPKEVPDLGGANLRGTNLISANLSGATLAYANLIDADLSSAKLESANLREANLHDANLRGANLRGANLSRAKLGAAILSYAHLGDADLSYADLRYTTLKGADLKDADLRYTTLKGADLRDADLRHANLSDTRLELADLSNAIFANTALSNIDLSTTKGVDLARHYGPSSIGIDTLYRSCGSIPEVFLRGCGVPDDFITYSRSLIGTTIDFYSCFISYSSKNQDFADRIYSDLQSKGVRCWLATEDLKIGDKFRQRIDESIRLHDKLLLILSEESIASSWVEDEVESALERERREKRLVLFPITIDGAIWDTDKAWAASLRRIRHIGDFKEWKSHDSYKRAFERLLRDLKASEPDK